MKTDGKSQRTCGQRPEVGDQGEPPKGRTLADGEPFLTKEEVGGRMRKPVRTIEDWMRRRIIPFYKVGQAVRFRWSEVQAHFAARYRVAAEEQAATTPSSNANSHA